MAWSDLRVWVDHPITRYRQDGEDGTSGASALTIKMAKNEIVSFQVLVYNSHSTNAQNVDTVTITEGTSGITYLKPFKQFYTNMDGTYKSKCGATTGSIPEILIPQYDEALDELRNGPDGYPSTTYPVSIPALKLQGFWMDVGTTYTTTPGTYTINVAVKRAGETDKTCTVTVVVWNFALPSTSTTKMAMAFADTALGGYAHGLNYNLTYERARQKNMLKLLLYHRLGGIYMNGNPTIVTYTTSGTVSSWSAFDSTYGDALSGGAITSGPLSGAKLNVLGWMPWSDGWSSRSNFENCIADVYNKFSTTYSTNQLYFWNGPDEPTCSTTRGLLWGVTGTEYQKAAKLSQVVYEKLTSLGASDPKRSFITKHRAVTGTTCDSANLVSPGTLDGWTITSFDATGIYTPTPRTFSYTTVTGSGYKVDRNTYPDYYNWNKRDLWFYTSNDVHGGLWDETGLSGGIDSTPDANPIYTRLTAWIMWYYRIHGFLYYSLNQCWLRPSILGTVGISWSDQGSNIWRRDVTTGYMACPLRPQKIIFNTTVMGTYTVTPTANYDYYYSYPYVYVYCTTDPATGYSAIHKAPQPFYDIANEGGQGDGNWIFPGVTTCASGRDLGCGQNVPSIGGTTDTVLGGITLKLLRDSFQDREYMELLRAQRGEDTVRITVNSMFTKLEGLTCNNQPPGCGTATVGEGPFWCLNTSYENLLTMRENMANLLLAPVQTMSISAGARTVLISAGSNTIGWY